MAEAPRFYDIRIDAMRDITQSDVDKFLSVRQAYSKMLVLLDALPPMSEFQAIRDENIANIAKIEAV